MDDRGQDVRSYLEGSYRELHALAAGLRRLPGTSPVRATSLAHDVWLRLAERRSPCRSREHFLAIAARAVRDALVDRARRRSALKRVAEARARSLDEGETAAPRPDARLVALHDALGDLARFDARKARIVELRSFGGLTVPEIAGLLGLSTATVKREWTLARAWLLRAVHR